jgi:hypothetical protein
MGLVDLLVPLLPAAAVVTLVWFVLRAISVRVVWRESGAHRLDDEMV